MNVKLALAMLGLGIALSCNISQGQILDGSSAKSACSLCNGGGGLLSGVRSGGGLLGSVAAPAVEAPVASSCGCEAAPAVEAPDVAVVHPQSKTQVALHLLLLSPLLAVAQVA